MKTLLKYLFLWLACVLIVPATLAAQTVNGNLTGTFTGTATDGSGTYTGNIDGTWTATGTFDQNGNFVENVTGNGAFGGQGIAGNWTMTKYNAATKTISVTWTAPGNRGPASVGGSGTADGSVTMVVDTATGKASGSFTGQFFTADGSKTINGTWTVQFQGLPASEATGKIQGNFTGTASYLGAISGAVEGTWRVRFMPDGSVTGTASGSYNGGNYTVSGYNVCVCGTWVALLAKGSDGQFLLEGSWTHPDVSGTLGGSGGGPIVWYIDTSASPIQASGNFSGASSFPITTIPGAPPMNISISTSGNWTATLPIDP